MNGPWDSYAPGTPESRSENWTQRVDDKGNAYWSYLGGGPGLGRRDRAGRRLCGAGGQAHQAGGGEKADETAHPLF